MDAKTFNLELVLGIQENTSNTVMLEGFCKRETRARYRRNIGVARFLATFPKSTLHNSYVRIKVSDESALTDWITFASEYSQATNNTCVKGSFIIEAYGLRNVPRAKGVIVVNWTELIDWYDIYTFCALRCSDTNIPLNLRPYLVELVSIIANGDVELAQACIGEGNDFMRAPGDVLQKIMDTYWRSNGCTFEPCTDKDILLTAEWEAQIRIAFPVIEKYRSNYVKSNAKKIKACLPTTDREGKLITEYKEVELGLLIRLVGEGKLSLTNDEYIMINFLRNSRNTLAHLNTLSFEDVQKILRLDGCTRDL